MNATTPIKNRSMLGSALLCAGLALAVPAFGVADPAVPLPVLEEERVAGIAYLNGGAGEEEVAAFKRMAPRYNLRIVISGHGGEYGVADQLVVSGPNGVRAEISDAGPWLLMKLPPGRYTLEATFRGRTERRTVSVGQGHTMVHWNTPAASS